MRQNDVRTLEFEVFEGLDGLWMVCGWSEIVNNRTGFYDFKIFLCRLKDSIVPSKQGAHDYGVIDHSPVVVREVNIGMLKYLPFGTIIGDRQVKAHIWDYRTQPKSIQINPAFFQDVRVGQWLRANADLTKDVPLVKLMANNFESMPAKLFESGNTKVIIMENDIIDYFFMAGSPRMAQYIFAGEIDRNRPRRNKVFDPSLTAHGVTPHGQKVASVRLERGMYDCDALLIALLAHDEYYWNAASKINTSIVSGEKYLRANLPIEQTTSFKVFGRAIDLKEGSCYLVHRIIKCEWKLPFECLMFSRDNPGKAAPTDPSQQPDNIGNTGFFFHSPRKPKKQSPQVSVGGKKAGWNNAGETISFPNTQSFDFPESNIIKEEHFVDGSLDNNTHGTGLALVKLAGFTTSLQSGPDGGIVRITFLSRSPANPLPRPPLSCFALVEKALSCFVKKYATDFGITPNWSYRVPFKYEDSNYSIFEGRNYIDQKDPTLRNFCFVHVKQRGYEVFRRICIIEVNIAGEYFYLMDVEPKYNGRTGYSYLRIMWMYAGVDRFSDEKLGTIMHQLVMEKGNWEFVKNASIKCVTLLHYAELERIAKSLMKFACEQLD